MANRAPPSETHYLGEESSGDAFAYTWDATPVVVPSTPATVPDGVSAVLSLPRNLSKGPKCRRAGLSRASLYVVNVEQSDATVSVPSKPPVVIFELWTVGGETASRVFGAKWSPPVWSGNGARGFLLQVSGLLADGFEWRACVDPTSGAPSIPRQLRFHLHWVVDREGGGFEILVGANIEITVIDILQRVKL